MMVASADGQYLVALESVIPGHDDEFPAPIAFNNLDRTGYPAAVWKYLIKSATLGRS